MGTLGKRDFLGRKLSISRKTDVKKDVKKD